MRPGGRQLVAGVLALAAVGLGGCLRSVDIRVSGPAEAPRFDLSWPGPMGSWFKDNICIYALWVTNLETGEQAWSVSGPGRGRYGQMSVGAKLRLWSTGANYRERTVPQPLAPEVRYRVEVDGPGIIGAAEFVITGDRVQVVEP